MGATKGAASPATVSFAVWGTTATLMVTRSARLASARSVLDAELARVGAACDRFRAGSELSRLNAAAGRTMRVSATFVSVLAEALRVADATDGTVDPTVGPALTAAGYDRDFDAVRAAQPRPYWPARPAPGRHGIELGRRTVRLPPGAGLDLGAVAKAVAADRAAANAARVAGCGVLVALGGDIAVAGPAPAGGWPVRVAEDHRAASGTAGHVVTIDSGGLATSSVTVRRWRRDDGPMHHIIDPATGLPIDPYWRTVSVAAGSCVDANAAAISALVRGNGAEAWLTGRKLPAWLVHADGTTLAVAGWPEPAGRGA